MDTGLIGDKSINCHLAYENGIKLIEKVSNGRYFSEFHLKKADKVIPLSALLNSIKIGDELISVDPNSVFNSILSAKDRTKSLFI